MSLLKSLDGIPAPLTPPRNVDMAQEARTARTRFYPVTIAYTVCATAVATLLQCYVLEEWVHYAVHFHNFKGRYFVHIRRHHLYHHGARGRDVAFGLTSALWDGPLGTPITEPDRGRLFRPPAPSATARPS